MISALVMFTRTMLGILDMVSAGVALGNFLSDPDIGEAYTRILQEAHLASWGDISQNDGLNSGQQSMALMAQDAGSEAIDGMGFGQWDVEEYKRNIFSSVEGAREGLSQSVDKAAIATTAAYNEAAIGASKWAAKQKFGG